MIPLAQAAKMKNLTVWQLRNYAYLGLIPYYKSGNGNFKQQRVFFKKEDLDKFELKFKLVKNGL